MTKEGFVKLYTFPFYVNLVVKVIDKKRKEHFEDIYLTSENCARSMRRHHSHFLRLRKIDVNRTSAIVTAPLHIILYLIMPSTMKKENRIQGSPASVIHTPSTAELPPIDNELAAAQDFSWTCKASEKSLRTINPIRAIVDPIVASSLGEERLDGKSHISLAVCTIMIVVNC